MTNYVVFVMLMIVACTWHPKFIDKFVFKFIKKAANDGKVKRWIYQRDWVFDTVSGIILGDNYVSYDDLLVCNNGYNGSDYDIYYHVYRPCSLLC